MPMPVVVHSAPSVGHALLSVFVAPQQVRVVVLPTPSPCERVICVVVPISATTADRLLCAVPRAARRFRTAVPERRTSLDSVGERNTRRLFCWPSGVPISVASLMLAPVFWNVSVSAVPPPATPPSVPAPVWLEPPRRYTSVVFVPGIGHEV